MAGCRHARHRARHHELDLLRVDSRAATAASSPTTEFVSIAEGSFVHGAAPEARPASGGCSAAFLAATSRSTQARSCRPSAPGQLVYVECVGSRSFGGTPRLDPSARRPSSNASAGCTGQSSIGDKVYVMGAGVDPDLNGHVPVDEAPAVAALMVADDARRGRRRRPGRRSTITLRLTASQSGRGSAGRRCHVVVGGQDPAEQSPHRGGRDRDQPRPRVVAVDPHQSGPSCRAPRADDRPQPDAAAPAGVRPGDVGDPEAPVAGPTPRRTRPARPRPSRRPDCLLPPRPWAPPRAHARPSSTASVTGHASSGLEVRPQSEPRHPGHEGRHELGADGGEVVRAVADVGEHGRDHRQPPLVQLVAGLRR